MDSITQGFLGAAIGEEILGKKLGSKGAIIGAAIATIPDLDVALYLVFDKFSMLSIHRGFSHSMLFSVIGALIIAYLLSKMQWMKDIDFRQLLLFTWLCLFTHCLLDTFTAYGTQLFLPFSDERVGFDSINVVDPLYTLPLILGIVFSTLKYRSNKKRAIYNRYGLLISSLYLILTLINKEFVKSQIISKYKEQGIEYNSLLTMPVGIANINWFGVAKGLDSLYMIEHSVLSGDYSDIHSFPINDDYLNQIDEKVADKMRWFAKGYYTVEKNADTIRIYNLQVDMRGIVVLDNRKVPTSGYFEIYNENGKSIFTSGTVMKE